MRSCMYPGYVFAYAVRNVVVQKQNASVCFTCFPGGLIHANLKAKAAPWCCHIFQTLATILCAYGKMVR